MMPLPRTGLRQLALEGAERRVVQTKQLSPWLMDLHYPLQTHASASLPFFVSTLRVLIIGHLPSGATS